MKKRFCSVAFIGMLALPGVAAAQGVTVGPFAAFHGNADFGIGAFAAFPVESVHENFGIIGSFGFFFPGSETVLGSSFEQDYWELNADATYSIPIDADVTPFVLAGLNIANGGASVDIPGVGEESVSETDIGINLGGGIRFDNSDSFTPLVGLKVEAGGGDDFVIFAGLGFQVGG